MRQTLIAAVLVLGVAGMAWAAEDAAPKVQLHRGGDRELSAEERAKLAAWGVEFLKSADFNTVNQADILGQSVATIQGHYRETVAGDYLVITYAKPTTIKGISGKLDVVKIVVGLNRKDQFPSSLFTVDSAGRVVAFEKYAGILPIEIRPAAATEPAR